jgi:hypothetical protein
MRDVVHVNLLHCIVENGVFNVDDTNNKFMLNQASNALSEELGSQLTYADFPYLANQVIAYSYNDGPPTFYGVGKGGGALLWCEPTLQPDTPIHLDWAIKKPDTNAPTWNNNIGNATELMCIASNQTTTDGATIVVGGNNLVSQGHQTNFAICQDAGFGGELSTFDTAIAVGGPSKSVNGVAYVEVSGESPTPYWVCTGDDSLRTEKNAIKIDDTNNKIVINVVDLNQDKIFIPNDLSITVGTTSFPQSSVEMLPSGFYTKESFASTFDNRVNVILGDQVKYIGPVLSIQSSFDSNNNFTITALGKLDNNFPDDIKYTTFILGDALRLLGLNVGEVMAVEHNKFNNSEYTNVNFYGMIFGTINQYPQVTLQIQLGFPDQNFTVTFPSGNFSPADFATQLTLTLNTAINSVPLLSGRNVDLFFDYDLEADMFAYNDSTINHPFDITLKQSGEFQTPVTVAFGKIIGLDEYDLYFGVDVSDTSVGYNLVRPYSTWWSSDGITWTPITDVALLSVVGNCVSISNNNGDGPAVVIGTDDGVVYNDGTSLTNAWTKLTTSQPLEVEAEVLADVATKLVGTLDEVSETNLGKVYAVASAPNGNGGFVIAIGCLGGQVYYNNDFWSKATPTVTLDLLTTLLRSPNDYDPVCNAIKFTGNTDGNYPTWIFAGSSMSYITSSGANTLTGESVSVVQFNSGPAQNPSGYPYLEYINGIETVIVNDGSPIVYTCLVGDNSGQYSCSDITSAPELNSWTGVQPFANNILIQIPVGYYTNTSLVSTIAELLNNQAISGNGTFYTEVQADGTFVIANTTSGNWGIRFMNGLSTYEGTATLLGFSDVSKQYEPSVLQGQEGPYTLKSDVDGGLTLTPFEYVLVQSDKFGNDLMTSAGLSAWWLVPNVANGVNANSIVYENTRNPTLEYLNNPRDIEQFDIRVLNSDGQVIELQDNKNVTLVIEFYTKKAGCR